MYIAMVVCVYVILKCKHNVSYFYYCIYLLLLLESALRLISLRYYFKEIPVFQLSKGERMILNLYVYESLTRVTQILQTKKNFVTGT